MPAILRRHAIGALAAPVLLRRAEAQVTPEIVSMRPEIEPLVALIEATPREKCAQMAVDQMRRGVSYRQMLAALFLAGIRNVNPQPPGFALHCVFVIHSAHLIGLEAPPESRLLPLFYALDTFKASEERDARSASGDYRLRRLDGPLPGAGRAKAEFLAAMDAWDAPRAERAAISLARAQGPIEAFELLWRYGARDYRNIGHKAIFVANAARTLHAIGWLHAEPVLRSIVYGLLDFGQERQVNGYAFDDQCWAGNLKRAAAILPRLPETWASKPAGTGQVETVLNWIRRQPPEEACAAIAAHLVKGQATAQAVWDAIHLAGAELRMRCHGGAVIAGLHAVTAANALHHAYLAARDPETRLLMLLQGAGWMGQFRTFIESRRDGVRNASITQLEPGERHRLERSLEEIFAAIPSDLDGAASRIFGLAADLEARAAFLKDCLRLTIAKANEVHYYKYLAALIEDIPLVSPRWQPHLASAVAYYVKGAADPEPAAMKVAREALKALA